MFQGPTKMTYVMCLENNAKHSKRNFVEKLKWAKMNFGRCTHTRVKRRRLLPRIENEHTHHVFDTLTSGKSRKMWVWSRFSQKDTNIHKHTRGKTHCGGVCPTHTIIPRAAFPMHRGSTHRSRGAPSPILF